MNITSQKAFKIIHTSEHMHYHSIHYFHSRISPRGKYIIVSAFVYITRAEDCFDAALHIESLTQLIKFGIRKEELKVRFLTGKYKEIQTDTD